MKYVITREVSFLNAPAALTAIPHVQGILQMWRDKNFDIIVGVQVGGDPLKLRWRLQVESVDEVVAANEELQRDPKYQELTKSMAPLIDNKWCDQIWRNLGL